MRYSIEPRDGIYVKGNEFLPFTKNMGTDAAKVAKNLSNNYSQELLDCAKKSTTDTIKIMEHQKIINLLDNTTYQPSKFKTKNWVEIYDESKLSYNNNSQINLKTAMLKSALCDYSDAYILVNGTIRVPNTGAADVVANNANKKVIFKNCAPFINCISKINNTQVDNAKDTDVVMTMYNLIEYSVNHSKIVESNEVMLLIHLILKQK